MGIISTPLIPENRVKTVLMSCVEKEGSATLEKMGVKVIETESNTALPEPVAHHPDMLFLHLKENLCAVINKKQSFVSNLEDIGFSVIEAKNRYYNEYPHDIGLNCLILGKAVIGNIAYIDSLVKETLNDYKFINVSQGYTKCSVCVVNEHSIITEDESIYNALKNNFDVLKIESGFVDLKGYNCGFFGGCTGLIDKNLLAVNGELKYHKSNTEIIKFLKERNVDILEIKKGNLTDIGSILPLEEK